MNIITQNPFRILGLTGNASERELQKQIGIIKRFAEIGKSKTFDYDFEFMGDFSRNIDDINQAASKIEQAQKKLHYSLFWFIKNNQFDEIALNNIKDQNTEKAIEIWGKTLKEEISSKNYSSYLNLSTLYIALSTIDGQLEIQSLQKGIDLKGILIHSDSIKDFSKLVTGNGLAIDATDISKKFIEEIIELLKPYINKRNGISTNELISLFNSYPQNIQKYLSGKFTEAHISNIENKIEKTIVKRKENPRDAEDYGEELFKTTKADITLLLKLLGENNVQFQMIADKLANEILQCSIDFFNELREEDGEFDPGNDALRIAKYALSIGPSGQTKHRIEENTAIIQEWVDDKPNRQRQEAIAEDLAFITNKLQRFQSLSGTIENAKDLVVSCKPKLANIKNKLGVYDDYYLQFSSAIVSNALGMIIEVVNREQSQLQYDRTKLLTLPSTVSSVLSVVNLMGSLDMIETVRSRYNINKRTISSINSQLQTINQRVTSTRSSSSSGGCYIATMAYGDYDHPQVKVLRKFRDDKLANSLFGKSFINLYYATTPKLVKVLKNHKRINEIIRNLLDKFIKHIK